MLPNGTAAAPVIATKKTTTSTTPVEDDTTPQLVGAKMVYLYQDDANGLVPHTVPITFSGGEGSVRYKKMSSNELACF